MIVAVSILLAALVGGVVFVLLDNWQRRAPAPASPQPTHAPPIWTPPEARRTEPLPPRPRPEPLRPTWDADDRPDDYPPNLWSGWARREQK